MGNLACLWAIAAARRWARGETDLEEVWAARDAADAAAYAAADAAAYAAADAAAYAAADAAAARAQSLARSADLVRARIPWALVAARLEAA